MRAGVEPKPELQCMFAWIVPGTCQARATSIPGLRVDPRASLGTFSQRSAIADAFLTQERSKTRLRKYSESLRYSLHSVISSQSPQDKSGDWSQLAGLARSGPIALGSRRKCHEQLHQQACGALHHWSSLSRSQTSCHQS